MIETLEKTVHWLAHATAALDELLGSPAFFDPDIAASLCGRASICNRTLTRLQRRLENAGIGTAECDVDLGDVAERQPVDRARFALERVAAELAALQHGGTFNAVTLELLSGLAAILMGMRRDVAAGVRSRFTFLNVEQN